MNLFELQKYILNDCQDSKGGLRDKPGKSSDFYHTCYCLSGLSITQNEEESYTVNTQSNLNQDLLVFIIILLNIIYLL